MTPVIKNLEAKNLAEARFARAFCGARNTEGGWSSAKASCGQVELEFARFAGLAKADKLSPLAENWALRFSVFV